MMCTDYEPNLNVVGTCAGTVNEYPVNKEKNMLMLQTTGLFL